MNSWLSQSVVQALGWTLIHFLWQGLAIAAVLAVALRLMRRAAAQYRYLAGCAALLLMAVAPLVTFRLVAPQPQFLPAAVAVPAQSAWIETTTQIAAAQPSLVVIARPEPRALTFIERLQMLLPWLVIGWLAGVCALSCRLFAGWLQVRRLRKMATTPLPWSGTFPALAQRLGVHRPIRLLQSALVAVPTVIGWLRPVILLPATCLTGLSPAQLEAIIAHELAHIRRHDYLVNLLQSAVETLLFYHPAVWWVSRRIREEREHCCDDLAVEVCGDRVGYARALATLEELRPASAQLALAATGAPLLRRIRRLVTTPERSAGRASWPVAGIIVLLVLAVLMAGTREHRAAAQQHDAQSNLKTNDIVPINVPMTVANGAKQPPMPGAQLTDETNTIAVNQTSPPETNTQTNINRAPTERRDQQLAATNYNYHPSSTTVVSDGKGRQVIISKLDRIRIDNADYEDMTLAAVLDDLTQITRDRDPDGKGINFFSDQSYFTADTNGNIISAPSPDLSDVSHVKVRVALNDVRLADVLDAIVNNADHPVKYTVLDNAVVFSLKDTNEHILEIRTFHVDPRTFLQKLHDGVGLPAGSSMNGPGEDLFFATSSVPPSLAGGRMWTDVEGNLFVVGTNDTYEAAAAMRAYFLAAGVDLSTNSGKVVIFNNRKGTLTVRATARDMDLVEAALQALNPPQPEVHLEVKFIEVTQNPALGFTWYVGKVNATNAVGAPVAIGEPIAVSPAIAGSTNWTPVSALHNNTDWTPVSVVQLTASGLPVPEIGTPVGPQNPGVITAFPTQEKVLAEPAVVTLSGQKARVSVLAAKSVVYGATNGYTTSNLMFGPTLDVVASILANNSAVHLELAPSITEFLGYDPPVKESNGHVTGPIGPDGRVHAVPLIRTRTIQTNVTVWDGQTAMIWGPVTITTNTVVDRVPLLGGIPVIGHLFRSQSSQALRKQLLVFVTATIINPDGTVYRSEKEKKFLWAKPPPQDEANR
jgi:beta-lactamase regulating signal transducer with metallopeptidase domain/Flp pilus assembly secretin CpaC